MQSLLSQQLAPWAYLPYTLVLPQQSQQKPMSLTLLMVQSQKEEKIGFERALESVGMNSFLNDF